MRPEDFDFDLPEALIATRPVRPRSAARLLVARGDRLEDRHVRDLPQVLRPGDLLVFNDTRVLPARLSGLRRRPSGQAAVPTPVEITLSRPLPGGGWQVLARPLRRLRPGDHLAFGDALSARVTAL